MTILKNTTLLLLGTWIAVVGCEGEVSPPQSSDRRAGDSALTRSDAPRTHDGPASTHDLATARPDQRRVDVKQVDPCQGVTCSGHGTCSVDATTHQAKCTCELMYLPQGLSCVYSCDTITCKAGEVCVAEHHGVTDPKCMPGCDCSNCGNCSMSDFAAVGTTVLYCGAPGATTPTKACTKPCPSGYGCVPYAPAFCWPGQGCMSQ